MTIVISTHFSSETGGIEQLNDELRAIASSEAKMPDCCEIGKLCLSASHSHVFEHNSLTMFVCEEIETSRSAKQWLVSWLAVTAQGLARKYLATCNMVLVIPCPRIVKEVLYLPVER